jgi:hypothetical protein
MQKIIDNPPKQGQDQSHGQYCLSILTPEYRGFVWTSNLDWKQNILRYLEGRTDFAADVEASAIQQVMNESGLE